jgi:transketolase
MKIDNSKSKLFSSLGQRATFGLACLELIKKYENLMVVTADVSTSAGLDRYKNKFKENYLDVGIAEQNMMGIATGLSTLGYNVFTTTFAPFQSMRCLEQIKVNQGYMKKKVTMVGIASGVVLGTLGYTHCCIEDLSIMRSIPGLTVLSPSDGSEVVKSVFAAAECDSPVYIRLTGSSNSKIVNIDDYDFKIGQPIELIKGHDIIIFATGSIVANCIEASKELKLEKNLLVSVINVHTLKPINREIIIKKIKNFKKIITIEEHSVIGGLGSAINQCLLGNLNINQKVLNLGLPDNYSISGEYSYILEKYSLSKNGIKKKIIDFLNN